MSHAAYCLVVAEEGNGALTDAQREDWLARCDLEHDNFRAALDWLLARRHVEWGLRLAMALFTFWERREHSEEGRTRLEAILKIPGADTHTWRHAMARTYAGQFSNNQGDYRASLQLYRAALGIFRQLGDQRRVVMALNGLGAVARLQDDWETARTWRSGQRSSATIRASGQRVTWWARMRSTAPHKPHPIPIVRGRARGGRTARAVSWKSATARLAARAFSSSRRPSPVSSMPSRCRTNNVTPRSSSSWRTCRLSGGCDRCRRCAALVKLRSSATTTNARRCRRSTGRIAHGSPQPVAGLDTAVSQPRRGGGAGWLPGVGAAGTMPTRYGSTTETEFDTSRTRIVV
jgi:hypothetical protein